MGLVGLERAERSLGFVVERAEETERTRRDPQRVGIHLFGGKAGAEAPYWTAGSLAAKPSQTKTRPITGRDSVTERDVQVIDDGR